jgi:hypothetical protein
MKKLYVFFFAASMVLGNPVLNQLKAIDYVFNNGGTNYGYGFEMSTYREADDFQFSSSCAITGAKFWTLEGYDRRGWAQPFDGHIDYWIYPAVNGQPGPLAMASGIAQSISRTAGPQMGDLNGFEYTIDLQQPVQVQSSTQYFLALHMLNYYPSPEYGEFYWATTNSTFQGAPSYESYGSSGNWSHSRVYGDFDFAFELYAVSIPEPSTLAMLLTLALGLLPWRSRF